jgi:hypothetical protein
MASRLCTALVALLPVSQAGEGATVHYEELPYFSEEDSPFYGGIQAGTIYLEDFEDHQLNTPYVLSWDYPRPFSLQQGMTVRMLGRDYASSVDADDGLNGDYLGLDGDAWRTVNVSHGGIDGRMEFRFERDALGRLPTYVGFVITEVFDTRELIDIAIGTPDSPGNQYEALPPNPIDWNPNNLVGDTRAHRFFGMYVSTGVDLLVVNNIDQLDHLQYGYAIPEPATAVFLGSGVALVLSRRRRGHDAQL